MKFVSKDNLKLFTTNIKEWVDNKINSFKIKSSNIDSESSQSDQVLKSDGQGGTYWGTDSAGMQNPMNSAGDIIVGGTSGTPTRLGLGSNGKVLTSNGSTAIWNDIILSVMSSNDIIKLFREGEEEGMKITLWNSDGSGIYSTLSDFLAYPDNQMPLDFWAPVLTSKLHICMHYDGEDFYGMGTTESYDPAYAPTSFWYCGAQIDFTHGKFVIIASSLDGTKYIQGEASISTGDYYTIYSVDSLSYSLWEYNDQYEYFVESTSISSDDIGVELYFLI